MECKRRQIRQPSYDNKRQFLLSSPWTSHNRKQMPILYGSVYTMVSIGTVKLLNRRDELRNPSVFAVTQVTKCRGYAFFVKLATSFQ